MYGIWYYVCSCIQLHSLFSVLSPSLVPIQVQNYGLAANSQQFQNENGRTGNGTTTWLKEDPNYSHAYVYTYTYIPTLEDEIESQRQILVKGSSPRIPIRRFVQFQAGYQDNQAWSREGERQFAGWELYSVAYIAANAHLKTSFDAS